MKQLKQISFILLGMVAFIFICVGVWSLSFRLMEITEGKWYEFPVFIALCFIGMGITKFISNSKI